MDNKKVSQSGRPQRPTKRFQAYAEQSLMPVAKKRKKEQVHHQEAPSGKVGIGSSFASAPSLTSSTKQKGMREYSCTHCSFSKVCTSSQDFIKMHHMMKDNRRCYEKGLIHCPNPECNKVCLSHKDMEMHCSMKGSKNPCLKSYRDMRAMSSLQMRHSSTQVNFLTSSLDNTTQDTETDLLLHLGTLYNNSKHIDVSLYNPDSPSKPRNRNVIRSGRETTSHQYTSQSHGQNILSAQGLNVDRTNESFSSPSHITEWEGDQMMHTMRPSVSIEQGAMTMGLTAADNPLEFELQDDLSSDADVVDERFHQDEIVHHIPNIDVLLDLQEGIDVTKNNLSCLTREDKACILLEDMLRKANSPLYLYDKIMMWACRHKSRIPSKVTYITRNKLYKDLAWKIYGDSADEMKPKEVITTLPSGRRCGLSIFNIYSQIVALLGNANINSWENYFFTPTEENPFNLNTFTNWNTGQFDGIETSIWYKRTMDRVITDHQNEILVPICLFIDGTVLSLSGSLSLEPVMFSLMIHNRETRQKHEAWLPLGYIHDPTNLAGKKYSCATEKYTDYHHMLSLILKDMTDLVNCNDGLHWEFSNVPGFHRQKVRKKLIFRLAFIIGDTKGHDVLCCRMGSHNKTPGLCRDCNMTTANADNPNISCQFLKQSDLAGLNSEELRKMSFLRVPDYVFNRLSFGVSPYGINGATAIDIIHSILIGIMEYLYNTFIDQLTAKQYVELSKTVAFIATFCSKGMPGFPRIDHFKKGLDVKGIMTAKMKLARCFLVFLALNTVSFKSYLKDMTGKLPAAVQRKIKHRKKHAAEHNVAEELNSSESAVDDENDSECASMESEDDVSVDDSDYIGDVEDSDSDSDSLSLNSSTSYNSEEDSSYDPNDDYESRDPIVFTDNVYKEWSDIFEHTLTFYRWLTLDKMPCNVFKYGSLSIVKHCLDQYMKRYREIAYRHEGMGLKLTKFHQLRHWYFYISMYGVPTNFDSSFCESHHIYLTKRTGRRTQKRQDELAQQTAQRLYEGTLLNAAVARFMRSSRLKRCQRRYADDKLLAGAKFTIQFDYTNIDRDYIEEGSRNSLLDTMFAKQPKIKFRWARKKHNGKKPFPTIILDSITDKLAWFNNGVNTRRIISICGHTEIRCPPSQDKLQRKCIRANPDYRGNGLWTDWVNVSWAVEQDENMILPAQVLMILDFDSVEFEDIPIQIQEHFPVLLGDHATMNHDRRHGIQLLVHSASENVEEDYEFSIIKRFVMEPCFQIIDLENVCDIVFVAREGPILHGNPMTYNITRVFHAKFWGHSFIPRMCEGYTQFPAVELHHLDEFNETYNPW